MTMSLVEIVTTAQKSRKRRRQQHCDHVKTNRRKSPIITQSFMMTILLAVCAVVVQGELRTLRHHRLPEQQKQQHARIIPSRIGQQRRQQQQQQQQQQDQRAVLEARSEVRNEIHYGIGKHPHDELASELKESSLRKSVENNSNITEKYSGEELRLISRSRSKVKSETQYGIGKHTNSDRASKVEVASAGIPKQTNSHLDGIDNDEELHAISESESEMRSEVQYGIGKLPSDERISEVEMFSVQKLMRNDSDVDGMDIDEDFAEGQYEGKNNIDGSSTYFANLDSGKTHQVYSGGLRIKAGPLDSGETDGSNNYAIGNDRKKKRKKPKKKQRKKQIPLEKLNDSSHQSLQTVRTEAPDHDIMSSGSECLVSDYECCGVSDCRDGSDICVNRHCIDDGYFRFTLHYIGDDDYDLFVITPGGTEISYKNIVDPASLGKFGEEMTHEKYGYHVENIYFPFEGGPPGVYRFFVRPFITVGKSDNWTVTVVIDGNIVVSESGIGASESFYCKKDPNPTISPTISPTTMFPRQSPLEDILPPSSYPTSHPTLYPTPTILFPAEHPNRPPLGQDRPPLGSETTLSPAALSSFFPTSPEQDVPSENNECSIASGDECCVTFDCKNAESICEQRTCIREGNPRVTLVWTGDEDLDLFVITPDGVQISESNPYDMFSGGRFERSTTDQNSFGHHVENIYFPKENPPNETYEYGVRSSAKSNVGDSWSIEIHDQGQLVNKQFGSGDSVTFTHFRSGGADGPQRPNPQPSRCSPVKEECCIDTDCADASGDLCVQRTCINEGSLRITLEWIGDDDLQLNVKTPANTMISESLDFDTESGGRYQSSEPSTFGFHVKSVFFPPSGAPFGSYYVSVNPVCVNGVGGDIWTMRVYENGKKRFEEVGIGSSSVFRYELGSVMPIATMTPTSAPQLPTDGSYFCTIDSDCMDNQVCIGKACIYEGNPRFTLQWPGSSLYSLTVVTPGGKYISAFSPFDPDSGGMFEGPTQQRVSGDDVESVYFSIEGGPLGLYTYYVTKSGGGNSEEIWSMTVSINGKPVARQTGSGKSDSFVFQYRGVNEHENDVTSMPILAPVSEPVSAPVSAPVPVTAPVTAPSTPGQEGCNRDLDCLSDEICSFGLCVKKGAPQFLLSWEGDFDVALAVVTPAGKTISWQDQHDVESGGKFDEHIDNENNRRIENIYFASSQGPIGVYPYYVHLYHTNGEDDVWTLGIYVDGKKIKTESGQGSSEVLFFDYSGNTPISNTPTSTPISNTPTLDDLFSDVHEEEACDPLTISDNQCCSDSECFPNEACASRTCVDEGNPRFTLSWKGSNDLDLLVVTPLQTTISLSNIYDPKSGGKFGEDFDQYEYGLHVENIYFPMDGGPVGEYSFYVRSFLSSGENDKWTVRVFVKGKEQYSVSGTGNSGKLTFTLGPLDSYNR